MPANSLFRALGSSRHTSDNNFWESFRPTLNTNSWPNRTSRHGRISSSDKNQTVYKRQRSWPRLQDDREVLGSTLCLQTLNPLTQTLETESISLQDRTTSLVFKNTSTRLTKAIQRVHVLQAAREGHFLQAAKMVHALVARRSGLTSRAVGIAAKMGIAGRLCRIPKTSLISTRAKLAKSGISRPTFWQMRAGEEKGPICL